jgi:hypothetical protein
MARLALPGASASPENSATDSVSTPASHRLRLPKFISNESVGFGQIVSKVASVVGVKPCPRCTERAAKLDRWLKIDPWQK